MVHTPDDDARPAAAPVRRGAGTFGAGAVLAAAVGGLVLGVVVSVATGPVSGASGEPSAEEDLRTACRYVEAIAPVAEGDITVDDPLLWRLDAALTLVSAAEQGGIGDGELGAAATEARRGLDEIDLEQVNAGLGAIREHCA